MTGAAEQGVVAVVAENPVLAVLDQHPAVEGVEIQQEILDLQQRLVGIVEVKLAGNRVVLERHRGRCSHVIEERPQCLGTRQRVVAGAAMDEVVAQATVEGVVAALFPGQQVDGSLEVTS